MITSSFQVSCALLSAPSVAQPVSALGVSSSRALASLAAAWAQAARPGHSAGSVDVGAAALATGGTSGLTMVQQRDVVVTRARSQTVAIGGDKLRITRGFAASAASEQQTLSEVVARAKDCALNKDSSTSVLSALAERAMQSASELTPAQIRDLTVSFAKLGYFNTAFKSAMADAIIARLEEFEPSELADTAWAFGELQHYDYELMAALMPYLKAHAEKFDASGMAKMLWTFARFGFNDSTLLDWMQEIVIKLQGNCTSRSLADVLYSMAQLGWADARLHTLVADYAAENIDDFDAASLAKLAHGLAAVGYEDDEVYAAITRVAANKLGEMTPAQVAMILWACGEAGHLCPAFMSAVACEYIPKNVSAFTTQQLQTAVTACNKLGFSGPAVAAAAERLSDMLPHLVSNTHTPTPASHA